MKEKPLLPLRIILLLLSGFFFNKASAQTCTIQVNARAKFFERNFKQELDLFLSLEFEINGEKIKTTDTNSLSIIPNHLGFDTITYSFVDRGIKHNDTFICELRAGEKYTISLCTCCGIFLMTPEENAERGSVKYNNNSEYEFIAAASEMDYDTIPKKASTDFILSLISMNCGFRPNAIFIADSGYLDEKFYYENWENRPAKERGLLEKEQQSHVVYSFNYLFLHKEKLIVTIDETGKIFDLEVMY